MSSTSGRSNSEGEDNTEPNSNEGNAKSSKGKKGKGRKAVTYKRRAPNKSKAPVSTTTVTDPDELHHVIRIK